MKIHDEIDDWSAGALCDALSPDERKNFEQHLAECPHCRSLHEEDRKMNDILNQALAEERPDPNFEGRVVAGVREKISKGGFHPLRGLVWLLQFRVAQGAFALLILAALVEGGAMMSGERRPAGSANTQALTQQFPDMATTQANTPGNQTISGTLDSGLAGVAFAVSGNVFNSGLQLGNGSTDANGIAVTGGNPTSWAARGTVGVGDTATFNDVPGQNSNTVLGGNTTVNSLNFTGSNTTYSGLITGSANYTAAATGSASTITTIGSGTVTLSGANTYTGSTTIANGTLAMKQSPTLAAMTFASTGADSLNTRVTVPDSVDAPVALGSDKTWTLNQAPNTNNTLTVSGTISGAHSMTTTGTGILILGGNSTTVGSLGGAGTIGGGVTINSTGTSASGIQDQDRYDAGRVASLNETLENTGRPGGPKTLADQSTGTAGAKLVQIQQLAPPPIIDTRKLIRTATLDFEVASFDRALDAITAAAGMEQGYLFTQNSEKAADGKLQGEIVVKVLPANLDHFLLRIHGIGDLKTQNVSAQDVSKDYYDTESRMRNSEITEARMIDLLKKRTGDVSDLLEVEKEIAGVRGEIEQMQGQLKYYDGLVQFATVTITLEEKDLNQTAAYMLQEQAQLSLFAKDVEGAFTEAKNDAAAANAQTLESHMERDVDGREVATLHVLLPPENADAAILKLKAIGRIQTFTSQTQRVARTDGVTGADTTKTDRDKVELNLVIQHDVENAVQGTNISIQTDQVEDKTHQIKDEAIAAGVEIKGADYNRARDGAEVSTMLLRMPMKTYPSFIEKIKMLGKVKDLTVGRREDSTATDDAPAEIVLQIYNQGGPVVVAAPAGVKAAAAVHSTIGEAFSSLLWSARMIGVSLAFIAPWAIIGALFWFLGGRRWLLKKK